MQALQRTQAFHISRRHPDYQRIVDDVDFLGRGYLGGEHIKSADWLFQYPREDADIYRKRLERAYHLNYFASVVDSYVAQVFRVEPAREIPDNQLGAFAEDVTGSGEGIGQYMRKSLTTALVTGRRYIGVDLEEDGSPYLYGIHPQNLLDYSEDRRGIVWALVAERKVEDRDPFSPRQEQERYRLWTAKEWRLFDGQGRQVDSGDNRAGRVPIVPILSDEIKLPSRDIAMVNRAIFNVLSQLDEILNRVTFPQLYVQDAFDPDDDNVEEQALEIGAGRLLSIPPGASMPPGFIAPPDGPAEQHRKQLQYLVGEIYRLAGLERKDPDSQTAQSGVAKAYDFRETNARLSAAARICEEAELEIFEILQALGVSAGEVNISYSKDFNVQALSEQLDNFELISDLPLPDTVKRFAAQDLTGKLVEERPTEEKEEARRAIEEQVSFSSASPARDSVTRLFGGGE